MSRTFTKNELAAIIAEHHRWLRGVTGAKRAVLSRANLSDANLSDANLSRANLAGANLSDANLSRANLSDADLSRADLAGANLSDANLSDADLGGANLAGANLSDANLSDANLSDADLSRANLSRANLGGARSDFFEVLAAAPAEVPALLETLRAGRVNGTAYEGECACLVGTIANARKCSYREIPNLAPDSERPAERLFLAIKQGDTPGTNPIAKIAEDWIVEWMAERAAPAAVTP